MQSSRLSIFLCLFFFVPFLANAQAVNTANNFASSPAKQTPSTSVTADTPKARTDTQNAIDAARSDSKVLASMSNDDLTGDLDRLLTHYDKDAVLFNNIGAALYHRKLYARSEQAIKRAIMLNSHPAFLVNLSIVYDTEGKLDDAIAMAQRSLLQSPHYARGKTQLCELMLSAKRVPETVQCYDELSKFATLDPLEETYYAVALIRSHDPEKAIELLSPLVQGSQPTALMFNALGNAYYLKKRYALSADAFKRGVETDPDNAELRYNLAMALTVANNRDGALSQYNLIKNKDPKLADQLYRYLYRDKLIFVDEQTASKKQ